MDVELVVTEWDVVDEAAAMVVAGDALVDEATGRVVSATVPPHALITIAMTEIADLAFI